MIANHYRIAFAKHVSTVFQLYLHNACLPQIFIVLNRQVRLQLIAILYGHDENDLFVLYVYTLKQCSSFCRYRYVNVIKTCRQ